MRLLALLIILGGCHRVIPHDGRPVHVRVDDVLLPWAEHVERGCRLWDAVGLDFGLAVQGTEELPVTGFTAEDRQNFGDKLGIYSFDYGEIHVNVPLLDSQTDAGLVQLFAHEVGHSFGMQHIPGRCTAVMNPGVCGLPSLSVLDIQMFQELP